MPAMRGRCASYAAVLLFLAWIGGVQADPVQCKHVRSAQALKDILGAPDGEVQKERALCLRECASTSELQIEAHLLRECRISDEINYCMYFRDIELAEENSLDVLTGQHVSIHCAGNALSFPGSEIKLGRNSSLRLVGCRVGSLHSSEDLDSIEGDGLASDQVTRLLVAEAESSLVLQDTTMRMPETFPEMFFNQVLEQAQPDAIDIKSSHVSCTVGPLVHLNQYATWATTFNSAELPTGLSSISEGDDFKISALNVTFWGGPDPAAAQQVIRQAAEESRRDFVSCEELSELQKWPEVLFDALPTKESILTAAAGIISDGSSTEGSNNPSDRSSVVEQQRSVSVDSDRAVSPENVRTNTNSTLQTKVISAVSTSSSGSHDVLLSAPGQSVKRVSAVRDGQTQDSKRSATGEADDRPHETEGGGKGVTVGVLLGACFAFVAVLALMGYRKKALDNISKLSKTRSKSVDAAESVPMYTNKLAALESSRNHMSSESPGGSSFFGSISFMNGAHEPGAKRELAGTGISQGYWRDLSAGSAAAQPCSLESERSDFEVVIPEEPPSEDGRSGNDAQSGTHSPQRINSQIPSANSQLHTESSNGGHISRRTRVICAARNAARRARCMISQRTSGESRAQFFSKMAARKARWTQRMKRMPVPFSGVGIPEGDEEEVDVESMPEKDLPVLGLPQISEKNSQRILAQLPVSRQSSQSEVPTYEVPRELESHSEHCDTPAWPGSPSSSESSGGSPSGKESSRLSPTSDLTVTLLVPGTKPPPKGGLAPIAGGVGATTAGKQILDAQKVTSNSKNMCGSGECADTTEACKANDSEDSSSIASVSSPWKAPELNSSAAQDSSAKSAKNLTKWDQESGSEACLKDLLAADAFTDDKVVNHWKSVLTAASGIACTMRAMHATQACQGHLNPAAVVIQSLGSETPEQAVCEATFTVRVRNDRLSQGDAVTLRTDDQQANEEESEDGKLAFYAPREASRNTQMMHVPEATNAFAFGIMMWELMMGCPVYVKRFTRHSRRRSEAPTLAAPLNGGSGLHPAIPNGGLDADFPFSLNPLFPELPACVPLTYTLAMHACMRAGAKDRPTFAQLAALLEDVRGEVATSAFVNSLGFPQSSECLEAPPTQSQLHLLPAPFPSGLHHMTDLFATTGARTSLGRAAMARPLPSPNRPSIRHLLPSGGPEAACFAESGCINLDEFSNVLDASHMSNTYGIQSYHVDSGFSYRMPASYSALEDSTVHMHGEHASSSALTSALDPSNPSTVRLHDAYASTSVLDPSTVRLHDAYASTAALTGALDPTNPHVHEDHACSSALTGVLHAKTMPMHDDHATDALSTVVEHASTEMVKEDHALESARAGTLKTPPARMHETHALESAYTEVSDISSTLTRDDNASTVSLQGSPARVHEQHASEAASAPLQGASTVIVHEEDSAALSCVSCISGSVQDESTFLSAVSLGRGGLEAGLEADGGPMSPVRNTLKNFE